MHCCFYQSIYRFRKYVLTFFLFISFISVRCQIEYRSGYFVTNQDQTVKCLILHSDWRNNPTSFTCKLNETSEPNTKTISETKEFGFTDSYKFIRSIVDIDQSTDDIRELTYNRNPIWKKDSVFLKVLVEGKATLYSYEKGNLFRYFYKTQEREISQLIYKRFLTSNGIALENKSYQQQLLNDVKCSATTIKDVTKLTYKDNSLVRYFIEYLVCNGDGSQLSKLETYNKNTNVTAIIGIPLLSTTAATNVLAPTSPNFSFTKIGVELEYLMTDRNKWSFFIDPNIHLASRISFISMPFGFRHYFHLNNKSRLFLNLSIFGPFYSIEPKVFGLGVFPPFIGGGFSYDRFRIEARIPTSSDANALSSLMIGYNLSKKKK